MNQQQKAAQYLNNFRYSVSKDQLVRFQNKAKKTMRAKLAGAFIALVDCELICREWCEADSKLLEGEAIFQW